jgi:asparagine synthetase B (glutamine-hydrolysing)
VTAALKDSVSQFSPVRTVDLISVMKGLDLFPDENFYIKSAKALAEKLRAKQGQSWLLQEKAIFGSSAFETDMPRLKGRDALFKSLYIDFHFVQLPSVLRNFDRLSMAHGVEVRSPFLDWRLVSFAFSLPSTDKIGGGFTKRILRDAMKGILPESIRTRTQKLGFTSLPDAWSSLHGQEFICDSVESVDFQQSSIWDGKRILFDLRNAIRNGDSRKLRQAWIYVQAMSLMKLFAEKRNTYLEPVLPS